MTRKNPTTKKKRAGAGRKPAQQRAKRPARRVKASKPAAKKADTYQGLPLGTKIPATAIQLVKRGKRIALKLFR